MPSARGDPWSGAARCMRSSRGRAEQAAAKYGIPHVLGSIEELARRTATSFMCCCRLRAFQCGAGDGRSRKIGVPRKANGARQRRLRGVVRARRGKEGRSRRQSQLPVLPGYESLRANVKAGELGRIDHIAVDWHFALPILQFGPFDSWMLAAPANIIFELGPHLAAFIVDLIGLPDIISRSPRIRSRCRGQTVYRQWSAVGRADTATVLLSISITAGQADRILRVRGRGGSAQLDFGRDICWRDSTVTDNPIFDSYATAKSAAGHCARKSGSYTSVEGRACEAAGRQSVRGKHFSQHQRLLCRRCSAGRSAP